MSQDTDIGRVTAVMRTPGIRYRSFGNQPVRATPGLNRADSPAVSQAGSGPVGSSFSSSSGLTLASAMGVENLPKKQPEMEISFPTASASETLLNQAVPSPAVPAVAQVEGEGEASPRAETPAWRTTPRQEPVSAPVPPVLPLAAALSPAAAPPAPSPLGDASSLLATLRATEAQQAPAATMPPLLGMLGTAPAPAGAALSPAGAKPTAPPPLLAALTSPPPVPSATTSPAAAPTGVGEILRRIGQGQPPAPAAAVKPEEPAVPNVLRALRLTGLG